RAIRGARSRRGPSAHAARRTRRTPPRPRRAAARRAAPHRCETRARPHVLHATTPRDCDRCYVLWLRAAWTVWLGCVRSARAFAVAPTWFESARGYLRSCGSVARAPKASIVNALGAHARWRLAPCLADPATHRTHPANALNARFA